MRAGFNAMLRARREYEAGLIRRLMQGLIRRPMKARAADWELVDLDWKAEASLLRRSLTPVFTSIAEEAWDAASETSGVAATRFDLSARGVQRVMAETATRITRMTATDQAYTRDIVAHAIETHADYKQLASSLRDAFGVSSRRAETIARTETAMAFNTSSLANFGESGLVTWVEVFDGPECGWTEHDDPDMADGSIRSVSEAEEFPIAHPNCLRAFGPIVGDVPESELPGEQPDLPEPDLELPEPEPLPEEPGSLDDILPPAPDGPVLGPDLPVFSAAEREASEIATTFHRYAEEFDRLKVVREAAYRVGDEVTGRAVGAQMQANMDARGALLQTLQKAVAKSVRGKSLDVIDSMIEQSRLVALDKGAPAISRALAGVRTGYLAEARAAAAAKLPFAQRVRFTGNPAARAAFDRGFESGAAIERQTGLKIRWTGNTLSEADPRPNVAAWARPDGSAINMVPSSLKQDAVTQRHIMTHEMLHTASDAKYGIAKPSRYADFAGWEEGVVELAAHAVERREGWTEGYMAYREYTGPLQQMARDIARSKNPRPLFDDATPANIDRWQVAIRDTQDKMWFDMLAQPVEKRPGIMRALLRDAGIDPAEYADSFKFLEGANRVAG